MKRTMIALLLACQMVTCACAETTVYTATEDDQSALDVGGTKEIAISDALIQKTVATPPVPKHPAFAALTRRFGYTIRHP